MTIDELRNWLSSIPNQEAEVYFQDNSTFTSHLTRFDPEKHTRYIEHDPNPHHLDRTDKLVIDFEL